MIKVALIASLNLLIVSSALAQVERSVTEAPGLQPGIKAPLFTALDADSFLYSLEKALTSGPVVLIFYRGHWCPYCNKHLAQIQDSLELIYSKGASVVAVSPQKPEYLQEMAHKAKTEFTLLYDEGYTIENAYEVTFMPVPRQKAFNGKGYSECYFKPAG